MSKEEFKGLLKKLEDVDTAPEATVILMDFWEEVESGRENSKNEYENCVRRIGELQATCARLAQRVTDGSQSNPGRDEGETKEPTEEELEAEGRAYFAKLGEEV